MNKKKVKLAIWNGAGNDEQSTKTLSQGLLTVIVDVVVMFIFVWAARTILRDVFGVRGMNVGEFVGCIAVTGLISGAMELIDCKVFRRKGLIKGSVLLAVLCMTLLYVWIFKDLDKIAGGFVNFASEYLQKWNIYYKTGFRIGPAKEASEGQAVAFAITIIVILLVWIGKCVHSRLHFMIVAVITIALAVVVGYAPGVTPCIMMLIGVLMANVIEYDKADFVLYVRDRARELFYRKYIYVATVALGIIICCVGVRGMVSSSVKDSLKYSDDVKQLQKNILEDFSLSQFIKDLGEIFWDKNKGGEIISNMALSFDDVTVLKMHIDNKPKDKIYLKGFYGSEYRDGRWINDAEDFKKAVENDPLLDLETIQGNLSYAGMSAMYESADPEVEINPYEGNIEYMEKGSTVAYIPYFSFEFRGISETKGDVYYVKSKKQKKVGFVLLQEDIDYKNFDGNAEFDHTSDWELWYEEYVCDTYLDVPNGMDGIKDIASDLTNSGSIDLQGMPGENWMRVEAAQWVINWFASNMTYTVNPPSLPRKADPVEYFVTNSKKGYCMHYASAATLILREMGVPARYASGYYVSTSDFEQTDEGYVANVMDNASHAWVEIYLDKIGWVPIEVTTSYIDGINPNRNYDEDVDVDVEDDTDDVEDDTQDNEETSSEVTTSENETSSEENSSQSGQDEATTGGAGYYGTNNNAIKKNTVVKVIIFSLIALSIPAVIYVVIRVRRSKEEKLRQLVEKGRTSRAIKDINRRIYVKLKKKGKLIGVKSSDMAYKEVLVNTYPQVSKEEWDKYMDIVREMAFSKNDGTIENMEYCYEIYQRLKKE